MALPKFSELLFRINNPGQVNEISGEVRGRAAGMRVDREFGQKSPSKSDLRKGNTMADKHKRTQAALAADPNAPGFAKGYMTKKEEYSILFVAYVAFRHVAFIRALARAFTRSFIIFTFVVVIYNR